MQRLQPLERHDDAAPRTADAGVGAARLDAAHAVPALVYEIGERQRCPLFLALKVEDRGGRNAPEQEARRVILRIAADLADAPPHTRECGGHIRRRGALADAALAVERYFFHAIPLRYGGEELVPRLPKRIAVENPRRLLNTIHNVLREIVDVARPRMPDLLLPHGGHLSERGILEILPPVVLLVRRSVLVAREK